MRTKAERRYNDFKKAIRKREICRKVYNWEWYGNLHQYSKNKIHCSCPMCREKTNRRKSYYSDYKKTKGKNLTHADLITWVKMNDSERDYEDVSEN